MSSNIVLVGLDECLTKMVANELATDLDMFFLDINDLIKYSLNEKDVISKLGKDYLDNQIKKLTLSACDYENTIITCPYDLFLNEQIWEKLKQVSVSIFLNTTKQHLEKVNKKKPIDQKLDVLLLVYEEASKSLCQKCDFKVDVIKNNAKQCVLDIKQQLLKGNA